MCTTWKPNAQFSKKQLVSNISLCSYLEIPFRLVCSEYQLPALPLLFSFPTRLEFSSCLMAARKMLLIQSKNSYTNKVATGQSINGYTARLRCLACAGQSNELKCLRCGNTYALDVHMPFLKTPMFEVLLNAPLL